MQLSLILIGIVLFSAIEARPKQSNEEGNLEVDGSGGRIATHVHRLPTRYVTHKHHIRIDPEDAGGLGEGAEGELRRGANGELREGAEGGLKRGANGALSTAGGLGEGAEGGLRRGETGALGADGGLGEGANGALGALGADGGLGEGAEGGLRRGANGALSTAGGLGEGAENGLRNIEGLEEGAQNLNQNAGIKDSRQYNDGLAPQTADALRNGISIGISKVESATSKLTGGAAKENAGPIGRVVDGVEHAAEDKVKKDADGLDEGINDLGGGLTDIGNNAAGLLDGEEDPLNFLDKEATDVVAGIGYIGEDLGNQGGGGLGQAANDLVKYD